MLPQSYKALMTKPRPRVLLLEDNPALAESIEFALMTFGLEVVGPFDTNQRTDEALEALEADKLNVAILDLDLGNENSLPTARKLRALAIPFLFMSGHDMEEKIPLEFQNEICLPKPIEPELLVEAIQELLGACRD
ncbi:MAG: DNA-binding response OmpR family regulator [Planctomycetota bacterium]|jgi:DNA-binding response OmpR family regulator